ncbi:MAG: hypothetical protein AAGJ38_08440 [Planctomycetota bacterium]
MSAPEPPAPELIAVLTAAATAALGQHVRLTDVRPATLVEEARTSPSPPTSTPNTMTPGIASPLPDKDPPDSDPTGKASP